MDCDGSMGIWIIFPITMLVFMLTIIAYVWSRMFGRRGFEPANDVSSSRSASATPPETPLGILNRRYASGEITKEEFDDMKRALGQ